MKLNNKIYPRHQNHRFGVGVYFERIKKLQEVIQKNSFGARLPSLRSGVSGQAFLVLTKINRKYLSGFTGSFGAVLVSNKDAFLYIDPRYTLRAKKESALPVKPFENLKNDLVKNKIKSLSIEDEITLKTYQDLQKQLKVKLIISNQSIESLRAIKSAYEIAQIDMGSRIIDRAFADVIKLLRLRKNLDELQLAEFIERQFLKYGADGKAFDSIIAFGANAASPHHTPNKQKISFNNFLLFDIGALVNGYHSDFTRTIFLGQPKKIHEKVYNTVLKAQLNALNMVKPLVKCAEVDNTARSIITKAGFGSFFGHPTGHGVGLEIHEGISFVGSSKEALKQNMVVTVEPGIYLPGKFGVRIEDMVQVLKKPKIFSTISKELTIIK